MVKLSGSRPDSFLDLSAVQVGGAYLAQNGKSYMVEQINGNHVVCYKLLKSGAVSRKFPVNALYGYGVYFTSVIQPPSHPQAAPSKERWTHVGRTIYRNGKEVFSLRRHDNMTPVDMDQTTRLIVRMLNAVEHD